jgi:hypothetical protein
MMKHAMTSGMIAASVILSSGGWVFAGAGNPSGTGQPSQECADVDMSAPDNHRPGNASGPQAQGAFNPTGVADQVYAGAPKNPNAGDSGNPHANSQYDVACVKNQSPPQ